MLLIHRAERADALVLALADVLRAPAADPFASEIVAVPSRGVERWLAQQLSHELGAHIGDDGVCANVLFPSYTHVLDDAIAAADPDYAASVEAWSAERSVWPLLSVIEEHAPQGGLAPQTKQIAWEIAARCRLDTFTLQDRFIHNYGSWEDLLASHGLSAERITATVS